MATTRENGLVKGLYLLTLSGGYNDLLDYVIFAVLLFYILIEILLLVYKPNYTWPGLIIVLLGLPVYFFWRGKATV